MSFGWSPGDLIVCAKLAHDVFNYYQNAPQHLRQTIDKFQYVAEHLADLSDVLRKSGWEEYYRAPKLKSDLEDAKRFIERYQPLSNSTSVTSSRILDTARLGLGSDKNKLRDIDDRLEDHMKKMDAFKQHVIL